MLKKKKTLCSTEPSSAVDQSFILPFRLGLGSKLQHLVINFMPLSSYAMLES